MKLVRDAYTAEQVAKPGEFVMFIEKGSFGQYTEWAVMSETERASACLEWRTWLRK